MALAGGAMLAMLACSSAPVARQEVVENVSSPRITKRTCPLAKPRRSPAPITYREYLGRIGDRTWVLARANERFALVTLDDDGGLAVRPLPIEADRMATVARDGSRLWLVSDTQGLASKDQQLYAIDVTGSQITVGAPESLAASPLPGVSSFAIGRRRALFFTFAASAGFALWDRDKRAPIGSPVRLDSTDLDPPPIRCVGDACFAVAVPGDGPTRRLTVLRFDPASGAVEREQLADDHLSDFLVVPVGDRTLVLFTSFNRRGVFARELDATGRPSSPAAKLADGRSPALVGSSALQIAYVTNGPWELAALSADRTRVTSTTKLGLDEYLFVLSGETADGVLSVGISSSTDYDGSIHSWTSHGDAVFVPSGGAAEPPHRVWQLRGGGHGGHAGFPLVTPHHAAVLSAPSDDHAAPGELVVLRDPCP